MQGKGQLAGSRLLGIILARLLCILHLNIFRLSFLLCLAQAHLEAPKSRRSFESSGPGLFRHTHPHTLASSIKREANKAARSSALPVTQACGAAAAGMNCLRIAGLGQSLKPKCGQIRSCVLALSFHTCHVYLAKADQDWCPFSEVLKKMNIQAEKHKRTTMKARNRDERSSQRLYGYNPACSGAWGETVHQDL